MANTTNLAAFLASANRTQQTLTWGTQCLDRLEQAGTAWLSGLVDAKGHPLAGLTSESWGISLDTCHTYCSGMPLNFDFLSFSNAMTNYLLPWLALTAQLPFETGNPWDNVMSFCLAVGSPALVTYSLTITILNRFWVRERFRYLYERASRPLIHDRYSGLAPRIRGFQYLLQEAQQVPLRVSQTKGWLSSLLVLPQNAPWWRNLEDRLKDTRRGITASLVAQMLFAAVAYLFTIIAAFQTELGNTATALQNASGSLWIWLIPIILGWITVGTQGGPNTIEKALRKGPASRAIEKEPGTTGTPITQSPEQEGLIIFSGLSRQRYVRHKDLEDVVPAQVARLATVPTWFGADIAGDEAKKGPIFNYAKVFTYWQLAATVESALQRVADNIAVERACVHVPTAPTPTLTIDAAAGSDEHSNNFALHTLPTPVSSTNASIHNDKTSAIAGASWVEADGASNLYGDSAQVARYCGLCVESLKAYPTWAGDPEGNPGLPSLVYRRIFVASAAALFLQWGTTGSSILVAYLTPTLGLGCRSGSYLLYGVLGTLVWACLLLAMLLSHEAMLRHQDGRARSHLLCGSAVSLRYFGKFLAIANTAWLVSTSLMEFVGGFDNCWCGSNALMRGSTAWLVLYMDATSLLAAARSSWGGGLAMTLIVCAAVYTFFALGSWKRDDA